MIAKLLIDNSIELYDKRVYGDVCRLLARFDGGCGPAAVVFSIGLLDWEIYDLERRANGSRLSCIATSCKLDRWASGHQLTKMEGRQRMERQAPNNKSIKLARHQALL